MNFLLDAYYVVWNSLPEDIANLELSLEHFKTGLKTHLFRLAYA